MASRVLLIGLDGADWAVLRPLIDAGEAPRLAALCEAGSFAPLRSVVPPTTAAAWPTLATGLDPGGHGLLNFRAVDCDRPGGYDPHIADSAAIRGRTWIERMDGGVACVGLPMTYPPFEVPGVLVSGFPTPALDRTPVWPPDVARRLPPWPRLPLADAVADDGEALDACIGWDRHHAALARALLTTRDDRLTICVLSGTDHAAHRFWGRGDALAAVYRAADAAVGTLVDAAGDDTDVIVLSDHGFGGAATRRVHVGRWLERCGWSSRTAAPPARAWGRALGGLRDVLPRDRWWRLRSVLPDGLLSLGHRLAHADRLAAAGAPFAVELCPGVDAVCPGAARVQRIEGLADDLRRLPLALPGDGAPSARLTVLRTRDLYDGPRVDLLPPLLVLQPDGWRSGDGVGEGPLCEAVPAADLRREPGQHRLDGVLLVAGPRLRRAATFDTPPRLVDLAPTLCRLLGIPPGPDFAGRCLDELLADDRAGADRRHRSRRLAAPRASAPASPPDEVDEAARADIEARLRRLGYL